MLKLIEKRITHKKYEYFLKFGVVGILNTAVDFCVFTILNLFGVNYVVSQVVGYSSGTLNSYLFNKFWTFKNIENNKKTRQEAIQFIIVNLGSLAITELGLMLLIDKANLNVYIAKAVVIVLAQGVNYFSYKFWVFKK